ncbi:nucleotidyltransferase family protein [Faecalicatena contorta]|uniref:nucleotidyltransferase family protein n=1 Tax=Faecalicatena contorta TaxID=39482 RepID=UPI001F29DD5D|nr:sugar phosphate nucleotidyltransferase [Faecalicatena contorta]MCF2554875.1 nucleotidyltransferase [Faecalicatena contorta]
MKKATLVIMAAGIGSRFGGGIKQLEPVGPNGEIIMDYSIYDAMEAGFNKVVFVIRKDLDKDFKEVIGNHIEKVVDVAYAYQELDDIPEQFKDKLATRKKPWGTGQAILCCKDVVKEPFLVINADDYYGKEAYREAYQYLTSGHMQAEKLDMCMVGFVLKNTLSENGTVTRGVCKVDEHHMLTDIEETYGVKRCGDYAVAEKDGKEIVIDLDSPVSMNMWGLPAEFIDVLEQGFEKFLKSLKPEDVKAEYLLPRIIGEMLEQQRVQVKVLESHDQWFGVTYKEDKESVVGAVRQLIMKGAYPAELYK